MERTSSLFNEQNHPLPVALDPGDEISFKDTAPNPISQKAASMSPKFLICELLKLKNRLLKRTVVEFALNRGWVNLFHAINETTPHNHGACLLNFMGLRYWVGLFVKEEPKQDNLLRPITTVELADLLDWIRRSVRALESFQINFPAQDIQRVSWREKDSLGGDFQIDILRPLSKLLYSLAMFFILLIYYVSPAI